MSTRARIRMTDDEVVSFLGEHTKTQLATISRTGWPHLVTMFYGVFDGRIGFWTYRTSQKAVNLDRDPRVTCLVEAGQAYEELVGVQVQGEVERVEDPDEILRIGFEVYGRSMAMDAETLESLRPFIADQASKRWAYLVTPTKVASWDHRKLAAAHTPSGVAAAS